MRNKHKEKNTMVQCNVETQCTHPLAEQLPVVENRLLPRHELQEDHPKAASGQSGVSTTL